MICVCIAAQDGFQGDIGSVAAVVVNDSKVLVPYFLNDALAVITGELYCQRRRQQTCQRLRNDNTVGTDSLVSLDVLDDKLGCLFQYHVRHFRLVIAIDQGGGNVHQTACQGERANHTGKYRTVRNQLQCLFDGINVNLGASCADFRHFQRLCRFHALILINFGIQNRTDNRRNLIVRYTDRSAEAFCLNRQIHQAYRSTCVGGTVCHSLHALCLQIAVIDEFFYGNPHQLN